MRSGIKNLVAALLVLPALGATQALGQTLRASAGADRFWVAAVAGAACWIVVFTLLPKTTRLYVLGHELTHALAAWIQGRRVRRLRVGRSSGSVTVERPNWLIGLAPYFFPFYAALVTLVFATGDLVWGWRPYAAWFHLLLGGAYAFHVTFTAHALGTPQSDLAREGHFFSVVVIWLGNVLVLLVSVPLLTSSVGVLQALGWWWRNTGHLLTWLGQRF
jgi:hypothetical protein